MSTLLNFEDFLNESASAEAIEAPELQGKTTDIDDYNSQVKNMLASGEQSKINGDPYYTDKAKSKAYTQDTMNLVAAYANKKFKVPSWGTVKPATFVFQKWADSDWSSSGPRKGAGFWVYAARVEESKLDDTFYPTVYIDVAVGYDQSALNFDWHSPFDKVRKPDLKVAPGSYNGFITIYKRNGEEFEMENASYFTMDQLVKFDPNWKALFQGIASIAKKYSV
jgi:hypothetical protein